MNDDVFKIICKSVKETLNLSDEYNISLQSKLKEDLGLDSMSTLSFLMSLEENLTGFVVDPDTLDANHLETIESVSDYINMQMCNTTPQVAI